MPSQKVDLFRNMPIIHDTVPMDHIFPSDKGRGLDLRGRPREGRAYAAEAGVFPKEFLVPRSEWQARIKEREDRKITNRDVIDAAGLPPKDQEQTPYCWVNAPTYAAECTRVLQNQEMVILSAASAGAQITNYRAVGGWGKTALQWISDKGLMPESLWPRNVIRGGQQYATPANQAVAMNYRTMEWMEIDITSLDELISAQLNGFVVCVGLSWWGHEVTYVDPKWIDNAIAEMFRNSWGTSYGDNGYGILQGQRMDPDDAVCPRTMIAA